MFYLRAWTTFLPLVIRGGGIICGNGGFPSSFQNGNVKRNEDHGTSEIKP